MGGKEGRERERREEWKGGRGRGEGILMRQGENLTPSGHGRIREDLEDKKRKGKMKIDIWRNITAG